MDAAASTKGSPCSAACSPPARPPTPTAICRAASTTPPRHASRPSPSRPACRSTTAPTTTTDYFKAPHFEKYPNLNTLFNEATKLAGAGGTKGTTDVAVADQLLAKIDEIAAIFWETKKA